MRRNLKFEEDSLAYAWEKDAGYNRCVRTVVGKLCESKAFWPSGLAVIDEAEVENSSGAAKDFGYLLFGEACIACSSQ